MAKKKKKKPKQKSARRPEPGRWQITWRGKSWTEDDLTGQHLATLAIIAGDDKFDLLRLSPVEARQYPTRGFMRLVYMLSAFVVTDRTDGMTDEAAAQRVSVDALAEIQSASAEEIIGSLRFL